MFGESQSVSRTGQPYYRILNKIDGAVYIGGNETLIKLSIANQNVIVDEVCLQILFNLLGKKYNFYRYIFKNVFVFGQTTIARVIQLTQYVYMLLNNFAGSNSKICFLKLSLYTHTHTQILFA